MDYRSVASKLQTTQMQEHLRAAAEAAGAIKVYLLEELR